MTAGGPPGQGGPTQTDRVHGSAVSYAGRGCLILGASGRGKSTLALQLIALGATLIADDQVILGPGAPPLLSRPPTLPPAIEVRGVGLLAAEMAKPTPCHLVVDLDVAATARLPAPQVKPLRGQDLPCLHRVESVVFPDAILHYLRHGPWQPDPDD